MASLLSDAQKLEGDYNWLGAAQSYRKTLGLISERDLSRKGEVSESLGYALFRGARQAENAERFRERIREAVESYESATGFYQGLRDPVETSQVSRCRAMVSYLSYWTASEVAEKKRLLEEAWSLTKESLRCFQELGDALSYGKTHNQLSEIPNLLFFYDLTFPARGKIAKNGLEQVEEAIRLLSSIGDSGELAQAYVIAAGWLEGETNRTPDPVKKETYREKALAYWTKGRESSEEAALYQFSFLWGPSAGIFGEGSDKILTISKEALEYSRKTGDRLLIGSSLERLAWNTDWRALGTEDPDRRAHLFKEALTYAEDANQEYSRILFTSPGFGVLWSASPQTEYYQTVASFETDLNERRELLEKGLETAPQMLKLAEDSRFPWALITAYHVYSKALASLAKVETRADLKKSLIEKALTYRLETIKIYEERSPYGYTNLGVFQNYLANIRSELANLAEDPEEKKRLLQEAIAAKKQCIQLYETMTQWAERTSSLSEFAWLGERSFELGVLLSSLYDLLKEDEHLKNAAEGWEHAIELFQKANIGSRISECDWKAAQAYDTLEDYLKAAERFTQASTNYSATAEKIAQLKDFYQDYAAYMKAWSEIERARHHHLRQEYDQAGEHYQKAAELHDSTKRWKAFSSNYCAWSQVETAEGLSREEKSEESARAFQEAGRLFQDAKHNLERELSKIESEDTRQMATGLIKAAKLRGEYCSARIAQEEARILDGQGDHSASSKKYGQAIEILERVLHALESRRDRREISLILTLTRAWQVMERAEAEVSPELDVEAANLFEEARSLAESERERMLILGHSRFCRALEAGKRFTDTRDESFHAIAIQHLESAADYYLKAGLKNASEHVKANELLFDAYALVDSAKKERDQEKRAKLFAMAERLLQASAEAYTKAEVLGKRDHVLKLIEKVREEKQIASSLMELLSTSSIISTTAAFSTPTPTHEKPVGAESFDQANIQASLIAGQRSLKVGEDLDLEIELVNAGRGPAQLVKLEGMIPQGFELAEKPEGYHLEKGYINLKGKRLDPLKTEEVRLILTTREHGHFTLKPRILYLDEDGKYRAHEPEPVEITVRELGISGWIKGSNK